MHVCLMSKLCYIVPQSTDTQSLALHTLDTICARSTLVIVVQVRIEHGLCACTVDPLAKARGLSLRTGAQTMLYLQFIDPGQNMKYDMHMYEWIEEF